MLRTSCVLMMVLLAAFASVSCAADDAKRPADKPAKKEKPKAGEWQSLFNGKDLGNWAVTDFGKQGKVHVKDGAIHLPPGKYMTGITWKGEAPARMNYEIELEAQRVAGSDFFAGITFPVGPDHLSLILGGWGGGMVGISSFDGMDASENDTSSWRDFENGKWYKVRLRVTPRQIEAWLDGEKIINKVTEGHQMDVRIEVESNKPLGVATYETHGALRNIRFRKVEGPADPAPEF